MNIHILISALALTPLFAMAQSTEPDSIKTQELDEVVVEARNQRLGAEVSTYIPTSKQRNASQTAADLLNRMAIPQIKISANDDITDLAGKSVDVFMDFLPASKEDLQGMRMQDVKKVEYYDFPSDPRFQGKAHVVNFVMQKYEYGGYIKAFGWENTSNAGQASLYGKLQYKRMTFDIATGYFDIERSATNIFTLNMMLHSHNDEEFEGFSYTLGGDGEYLSLFNKYFEYGWDNSIASRSLPMKQVTMIMTDSFNNCKISCALQPF